MVRVENLKKQFGNKVLFDSFDLMVDDGEFLVLLGKSGSGKTTLLNMIGGIEPVTQGKIYVDEFPVSGGKHMNSFYSNHVSFLFQNFGLIEEKTVKENIEIVPKRYRVNYSVAQVMEYVGISDLADKYVYQLSGGEQQRTAICRAMIKKGNLILADEPTGSLDKENAENVMRLLRTMNEQGKTIIMVTHDENLICEGDRVVQL